MDRWTEGKKEGRKEERDRKNWWMERRSGSRGSGRFEIRWFAHKLDVISRQLRTLSHTKARVVVQHTVNAHNRDQIFESFWTRSSTDPNHPSPGGDLTVEPCAVILSTRFWVSTGWFISSVTRKGSVNRISSNYWTERERVTVLNRHLTFRIVKYSRYQPRKCR